MGSGAENPALPGYLAATDPRRRCVQCSCVMRPVVRSTSDLVPHEGTRPDGTTWRALRTVTTIHSITGYGYESNGHFCTMRCGFKYALRKREAILRAEREARDARA